MEDGLVPTPVRGWVGMMDLTPPLWKGGRFWRAGFHPRQGVGLEGGLVPTLVRGWGGLWA